MSYVKIYEKEDGKDGLVTNKIHGITQHFYVVTEETMNNFNNSSSEYQILFVLFSACFGGVISSVGSYETSDKSKLIFYPCLIGTIIFFFLLVYVLAKLKKIKNNIFKGTESIKSEQSEPMLQILKAIYSIPTKSVDVTEKIKSEVKDNKLFLPVSNKIVGYDLQKGIRKSLEINYKFDNTTYKKNYTEREVVDLP